MTDRLRTALRTIASMRHPSISDILRSRGFGYEADQMDELIQAWEEYEQSNKQQ